MRLIKYILLALLLAACGTAAQPTAQPTTVPDPLAFGTEATTLAVLKHNRGGVGAKGQRIGGGGGLSGGLGCGAAGGEQQGQQDIFDQTHCGIPH